jgi:hypothetical protein
MNTMEQPGPESSREISPRASARSQNTARSDAPMSSRSEQIMETGRSTMDTARVHTALAALSAERKSLLTKLAYIDSALVAEDPKKTRKAKKHK